MKGISVLLAVVAFAISFVVAAPTAKANGLFFRRQAQRQPVQRRQVVRQRIVVQQPHHFVAPLIAPVLAPAAIVAPPQAIIVQQPSAQIVVPQAFSTQAIIAY